MLLKSNENRVVLGGATLLFWAEPNIISEEEAADAESGGQGADIRLQVRTREESGLRRREREKYIRGDFHGARADKHEATNSASSA